MHNLLRPSTQNNETQKILGRNYLECLVDPLPNTCVSAGVTNFTNARLAQNLELRKTVRTNF